MEQHYVFFLGREPELSAAELRAVFSSTNDTDITIKNSHAFVRTTHAFNPEVLMGKLGGTVKIARQIPMEGNTDGRIADYLEETSKDTKIHFSLEGKALALRIKKILKERGRSVRYIEPKNSATILHNHLVSRQSDLTIIGNAVYATVALQPFEDFGERDFGRPGRDSKSGMLPPKLARMMINLAGAPTTAALLDPFCGSGTILSEAILLGYTHLIGSDLSQKAITDTETNLAWVQQNLPQQKVPVQLISSDVIDLTSKLPKQSIDVVVSEPYLGKPLTGKESAAALEIQAKELKKLYAAAFGTFATLLKPDSRVIFVFPSFHKDTTWIPTLPLEEIKRLGFAAEALGTTSSFVRYMRPGQHLARDIWKLRFLG